MAAISSHIPLWLPIHGWLAAQLLLVGPSGYFPGWSPPPGWFSSQRTTAYFPRVVLQGQQCQRIPREAFQRWHWSVRKTAKILGLAQLFHDSFHRNIGYHVGRIWRLPSSLVLQAMLRCLQSPSPSNEKHTLSWEDPSFFGMVLTCKLKFFFFSLELLVSRLWLQHE